jgi:hypothetical protein
MSLKVTLEEEPRIFLVKVGENSIGKVTSHWEKGDADDDENYHAALFTNDEDKRDKGLGWFDTLEKAGIAVVEYAHGPTKINKVTERIV